VGCLSCARLSACGVCVRARLIPAPGALLLGGKEYPLGVLPASKPHKLASIVAPHAVSRVDKQLRAAATVPCAAAADANAKAPTAFTSPQ